MDDESGKSQWTTGVGKAGGTMRVGRMWANKYRRGSYTVEAAIIVPLYLTVLALALGNSITMYSDIKSATEAEKTEDIWAVEVFYRYEAVMDIVSSLSSENK